MADDAAPAERAAVPDDRTAPARRRVRLAAGRARASGLPTAGTTSARRLQLMDDWIVARLGDALHTTADPLVIDLGYGSSPVTTVELAHRLRALRPDVRVLGLELDPDRVAAAQPAADPPRLSFEHGGFELAGRRPFLVRAANVLRQYDEPAAADAWQTLRTGLAPGGWLVEGSCDEHGRLGSWVLLDTDAPRSLTLSCRVPSLRRPGALAEQLPRALIHHTKPGAGVHELLQALDAAWTGAAADRAAAGHEATGHEAAGHEAAPARASSPQQRWTAAGKVLAAAGWPVTIDRMQHGELTVAWSAVAQPASGRSGDVRATASARRALGGPRTG